MSCWGGAKFSLKAVLLEITDVDSSELFIVEHFILTNDDM